MSIPENRMNVAGFAIHGLWKDQNDESHVSHVEPTGQIKLYNTRGKELRKFLRRAWYQVANEVLSDDQVAQFVEHFSSMCELEGRDVFLGVRTAWLDKNTICIDGIECVYVMTEAGWEERVLTDPLFR